MNYKNSKRYFPPKDSRRDFYALGFTMIELLVVVAIIGLLVSLILVRFNGIQRKSRDTRRIVDVGELAKALNLYNNDFAAYPIYDGYITGSDSVSTALKNYGYLRSIPLDPMNRQVDSITYKYDYSSDGANFQIQYCMETDSVPNTLQGCENYVKP